MNVIEVYNLYWRYPAFTEQSNPWVLNGLDLEVKAGEFFGITGPSGAGKTTTCKALLGILPHAVKIPFQEVNQHIRGTVRVLGETVTEVDSAGNPDAAGQPRGVVRGAGVMSPRVGMVLQDPENQFLKMSLLHEVAFGLQLLQLPR
jgi:energy-coupling factor transporter ATP-binding protein EcfA2